MYWCESCQVELKQYLDEQLSDVDSDSEFHYNWVLTRSYLTMLYIIFPIYVNLQIRCVNSLS